VQRRLTGLGFDTRVNGKFDNDTRAVIRRWQTARGYPASGYLNKLQHKALQSEIVASVSSSSSDGDDDKPSRRVHHSGGGGDGGGGGRRGGDPGAFMGGMIGGMMGGMFHR
jgi:peptidoglycan hydrolase-like protein with peptidoglycan-binding domain